MEIDNHSPTSWELGFTDDLFYGTLNINPESKEVTIVFIESRDKRKGNVKRFYKGLQERGWEVVVTRPCDNMNHLCSGLGYDATWEFNTIHQQWTWTWRGHAKRVKNECSGTMQEKAIGRRKRRKSSK
jgi:hypothetical protein